MCFSSIQFSGVQEKEKEDRNFVYLKRGLISDLKALLSVYLIECQIYFPFFSSSHFLLSIAK